MHPKRLDFRLKFDKSVFELTVLLIGRAEVAVHRVAAKVRSRTRLS